MNNWSKLEIFHLLLLLRYMRRNRAGSYGWKQAAKATKCCQVENRLGQFFSSFFILRLLQSEIDQPTFTASDCFSVLSCWLFLFFVRNLIVVSGRAPMLFLCPRSFLWRPSCTLSSTTWCPPAWLGGAGGIFLWWVPGTPGINCTGWKLFFSTWYIFTDSKTLYDETDCDCLCCDELWL